MRKKLVAGTVIVAFIFAASFVLAVVLSRHFHEPRFWALLATIPAFNCLYWCVANICYQCVAPPHTATVAPADVEEPAATPALDIAPQPQPAATEELQGVIVDGNDDGEVAASAALVDSWRLSDVPIHDSCIFEEMVAEEPSSSLPGSEFPSDVVYPPTPAEHNDASSGCSEPGVVDSRNCIFRIPNSYSFFVRQATILPPVGPGRSNLVVRDCAEGSGRGAYFISQVEEYQSAGYARSEDGAKANRAGMAPAPAPASNGYKQGR